MTGRRWVDDVSGFGSLVCGLAAAAILKIKVDIGADPTDVAAVLSVLAAVFGGIREHYNPRILLARDWIARSKVYQLKVALRANHNFGPQSAAQRLNDIIATHDARFISDATVVLSNLKNKEPNKAIGEKEEFNEEGEPGESMPTEGKSPHTLMIMTPSKRSQQASAMPTEDG